MLNDEIKAWFKKVITENNEHLEDDKNFYLKTISPEFVFHANGETCNFEEWYKRYRGFKDAMRSTKVRVDDVIAEGNTVAASYWIDCIKRDGSEAKIKIIGLFKVQDNRFVYCDELFWIGEGTLDL